jgi:uncharacterized MAPEG superfamily protein
MQEWLVPYASTVQALGAMAGLFLVQMVVLDVAGMRSGHKPGMPVPSDHGVFLFRATRAHANTNESIAAFVMLVLFGIFRGASPSTLSALSWTWVAARAAHMAFYYAGIGAARSAAFGLGFLVLGAMLVVGFLA